MENVKRFSGHDLNTLLLMEGNKIVASKFDSVAEAEIYKLTSGIDYFIFNEDVDYSLYQAIDIIKESNDRGNPVSDSILYDTIGKVEELEENRQAFLDMDGYYPLTEAKYKSIGRSLWDTLGNIGRFLNRPRPVTSMRIQDKNILNTFITRIEALEKVIESNIDKALEARHSDGSFNSNSASITLADIEKRRRELSREYTTYRAFLAKFQRDYEIIPARYILSHWVNVARMFTQHYASKVLLWTVLATSFFNIPALTGDTNIFSFGATANHHFFKMARDAGHVKTANIFYDVSNMLQKMGQPIDDFIFNNIGKTGWQLISYGSSMLVVIYGLSRLVMRLDDYFGATVTVKDLSNMEKDNRMMYVNYKSKMDKLKGRLRAIKLDEKGEKSYEDYKLRQLKGTI